MSRGHMKLIEQFIGMSLQGCHRTPQWASSGTNNDQMAISFINWDDHPKQPSTNIKHVIYLTVFLL